MSKKRCLAQSFSPDAISQRVHNRSRAQEELRTTFSALKSVDVFELSKEGFLSEDDALLLISAKIGVNGLLALRAALDHVPRTFSARPRGSDIIIRHSLISIILKKKGFQLSAPEVNSFCQVLEMSCPKFLNSAGQALEADMLWELTDESDDGTRYNRFIAPPVEYCLKCEELLAMHNQPTRAIVHGTSGPHPATKITLACSKCNASYGIGHYSDGSGKHLYPKGMESSLIEASNVTYMERNLYKWIPSLGNHCWVSFSGFSEAYNEVHMQEVEKFMKCVSDLKDDDETIAASDLHTVNSVNDMQSSTSDSPAGLSGDKSNKANLPGEMSAKSVAKFYWKQELAEELQDVGLYEKWVFSSTKGEFSGSEEDAMEHVEKIRCENLYHHDCSQRCQKKGCGTLYVADGNWKIKYPHCMWKVTMEIDGFKQVNYPNICPLSPDRGKAFCKTHCDVAAKNGIPNGLHDFLKYCGLSEKDGSSKTSDDKIEEKLGPCTRSQSKADQIDASTYQGTSNFIRTNGKFLAECAEMVPSTCNKDTGGCKTLHSWSRGVFFVVSAGGHIEYWQPLYRSESPSQAFLILILWLYRKFKPLVENGMPSEEVEEEMSKTILAYDNMCHVDGLKAAANKLPFPAPLDKVWVSIVKVIDKLHIRNHKDAKCKTVYNPEGKVPDGFNTMAAEQTFVWASRLKRIICAMPRLHQFFYLNRAVKRRNKYTQHCHNLSKVPLLPKQSVN